MAGSLIDRLESTQEAKAAGAERLDLREQVPHCDLALKTEAGYAFFRIIDPARDILRLWREAQRDIAIFLDRLSQEGQRRGAFLTLLVKGSDDPIPLQRIMENPYVCRKVVLPYTEEMTAEELAAQLPFFGLPDHMRQAIRRVPFDPLQVVYGTHLSPEFAAKLLERTSPEEIVDHLADYLVSEPRSRLESARPPVETVTESPVSRLKLRKITPRGFRNFGPETQPIRFTGDLVVIYGRNGVGKTSLCEALEWAITGISSRVQKDDDNLDIDHRVLLNLEAMPKQATVEVEFEQPGGTTLSIHRTMDGEGRTVARMNGLSRQREDRDVIWEFIRKEGLETRPTLVELRRTFQPLHFLGQHLFERFLGDEEGLHAAISRMSGTEWLDRLLTKGGRVLAELRDRYREKEGLLARTLGQLAALNEQHEQWLKQLSRSRGTVLEPAVVIEHGQGLIRMAGRLGIPVSTPDDPSLPPAWRATAQAIAQLMSTKQDELRRMDDQVTRFLLAADRIPATYQRRGELLSQVSASQKLTEELRSVLEAVRKDQVQVADSIASVEKDLEYQKEHQQQRARLQSLVARFDTLRKERDEAIRKREALQTEAIARTEAARRIDEELQEVQGRRERNRVVSEETRRRLEALAVIQRELPSWQAARAEQEKASASLQALQEELRALTVDRLEVADELGERRTELARLVAELANAQKLSQEREELISALQNYVHPTEHVCPFCTHDWQTADALQRAVKTARDLLPAALNLAQAGADAGRRQVRSLEERLAELQAHIQEKENKVTSLRDVIGSLSADTAKGLALVGEWLPLKSLEALTREITSQAIHEAQQYLATVRNQMDRADVQVARCKQDEASAAESLRQTEERLRGVVANLGQIEAEMAALEEEQRSLVDWLSSAEEPEVAATADGEPENLSDRLVALRQEAGQKRAEYERVSSEFALAVRNTGELQQSLQTIEADIRQVELDLTAAGVQPTSGSDLTDRLKQRKTQIEGSLKELQTLDDELTRFITTVEAFDVLLQMRTADHQRKTLEAESEELTRARDHINAGALQVRAVLDQAERLRQTENKAQFEFFKPLINVLYQRLSPHPYFGSLQPSPEGNRVQVRFQTRPGGDEMEPVAGYFSEAQRVSVILSLFLSAALLQGWTRLGTIFIDDPVQHMDDMNVHSFLDLLRGIVFDGRQIIVTTASEELYRVMLNRFGEMNLGGRHRFQALRLEGVTATGPLVIEDTDPAV